MAKIDTTDWEAVEREYRAGQLSIRAISRLHDTNHNAIRRRAEKCGWKRDLSNAVQVEIRRKILEEAAGSPQPGAEGIPSHKSEQEIVEDAAERALGVIRCHRKDLKQLRGIVQNMMQRLLPQAGKVLKPGELPEGVAIKEAAEIVKSAAYALSRAVPLERQAFNLDRQAGDENDPDSIIIDFRRDPDPEKAA